MPLPVKPRGRIAAWLLCLLLALFTVAPSQCSVCDGVASLQFGSTHNVSAHVSAIDCCDGVCSCCLLQVMPVEWFSQSHERIAAARAIAEPSQPVFDRHSSVFRPPRISSFS